MKEKKGLNSPLMVIFTTVFMDLVGFGMIIPLLPLYGKLLGADGWRLGILGAAYSAAQFLFAPFWGQISDRHGRRPMLLMSLAGATLSYLAFAGVTALHLAGLAAGPAYWLLLATRFFQGAFAANISAAQAYISDVTSTEKRVGGMALIGIAFGLGFIIGPPLGGLSMSLLGLAAPGLVAGGICGLNLALAWGRLPESLPLELQQANRAQPFRAYDPLNVAQLRKAWRSPVLGLLLAMSFLQLLAFSMMEQVFALFFHQRFNFSLEDAGLKTGYLLLYVGVIAAAIQGGYVRRAKRFDETVALPVGLLIFSVLLFLLPFGPSYGSYFLLFLPLGVGRSLIDPSSMSLISKASPPSEQGRSFGTFQGLNSLARVFGPFIGLTVFDTHPNLPFLLGGGVCVLVFLSSLELYRRVRSQGLQPQ